MPRYFFHVADGQQRPDYEGLELPDLQAARLEAVRLAGELLTDTPAKIWADSQLRVEVVDNEGGYACAVVTVAI